MRIFYLYFNNQKTNQNGKSIIRQRHARQQGR